MEITNADSKGRGRKGRQRRVEINSTFDEKPVRIVTEFRDLPHGPTYLARSVVDYPREELTLTMENFDYEHLGREEETGEAIRQRHYKERIATKEAHKSQESFHMRPLGESRTSRLPYALFVLFCG